MSAAATDDYRDVVEASLQTADGRTVAWTAVGPAGGVPMVRLPGTPGCRWTGLRADRSAWHERGLRVLTTERPGFGISTRVPRRSFAAHADDLALLLDRLGIGSAYLWAVNGGAPHALAFAARHPHRVRAVAVVAGTPPRPRGTIADRDALARVLTPLAGAMRADPIAAVQTVLASAPADDRAAMADPGWQRAFLRAAQESLAQGADGWIDEAVLLNSAWTEFEPAGIAAWVTWYHPADDPERAAVERFVSALPRGRVVPLDGAGAVAVLHREPAILDELLSR